MTEIDFASNFRDLVIPRLRNLTRYEEMRVAAGSRTYSAAWNAVMTDARDHGALYLESDKFTQLKDWISQTLLHVIMSAERRRVL